MTDTSEFPQYVEALTALVTVDDRRRAALRKAVEGAAATEDQERARIAGQQRMYARAGRDLDEAERALKELRSIGGFPVSSPPAAGVVDPADAPSLATIRNSIAEITTWTVDTKPVLESLLRSRDRLVQAQARLPAPPPIPPPQPLPQPQPSSKRSIWALGGTAAIVAIVIIVLVVSIQ